MSHAIATSSRSVLHMIDDLDAFAGLSEAAQTDVLAKLDTVRQVADAAHGSKSAIVQALARQLRVSPTAVNRYVSIFHKHGWQGLIDRRRFSTDSGLSQAFRSYVAGLYDAHQRDDDGAEVQRVLLDRRDLWRATGDPQYRIPGYNTPPANDPARNYPPGWSKRNILRLKPTKYQRTAAKRGAKDAADHLPPILTTRIGSAYLSRILFDDQDHDNLIADGVLALSGVTSASRPVSFNALDFFTGCHIGHHLRLAYKTNDPTTKKDTTKTLTSKEFNWFVITMLQTVGFRTDSIGTELIGEHRTAALWQNKALSTIGGFSSFSDAIHRVTDGHVTTDVSGLFNGPIFADLYFRPQSTGNFKYKTWIEAAFRLVRTYAQALPGPTGSHQRLNGPAELHGIELREKRLLRAMANDLDPHAAAMIQHELLSFQQFGQLIDAIYAAINAATDHDLEGWSQLGFTRQVWRPNPDTDHWFDQADLSAITDPTERQLLVRRLSANPEHLTRSFKLSRAQARELCIEHDSRHIARLPDKLVGLLLPTEWAVTKRVKTNHTFTLPNPLWEDTEDTYVCQFESRTGRHTLDAGMQLLVFANPFGDGRAHIYTTNREYIGTLHREVRAEPFNYQRKLEQLQVRSSMKSAMDAPLHARMADIAQHRQQRERTNDRILAGEETDPAARRSQAGRKAAATRRQDRLATPVDPDQVADLADFVAPLPGTEPTDHQDDHRGDLSDLL